MAEGARLESVYTRKCIEGSNPSHRQKESLDSRPGFCMVHRREGREASTGFDKTPAFWTANGGPQGERSESSPLTAKFKEKAWIRVQAFCMVHRREGREASTGFDKTPAFWTANGGPQGERSESSPLTAKESLDSRPGFLHGAPTRGASIFPLCDSDPHYRRLSTNFTADFLTHS